MRRRSSEEHRLRDLDDRLAAGLYDRPLPELPDLSRLREVQSARRQVGDPCCLDPHRGARLRAETTERISSA